MEIIGEFGFSCMLILEHLYLLTSVQIYGRSGGLDVRFHLSSLQIFGASSVIKLWYPNLLSIGVFNNRTR